MAWRTQAKRLFAPISVSAYIHIFAKSKSTTTGTDCNTDKPSLYRRYLICDRYICIDAVLAEYSRPAQFKTKIATRNNNNIRANSFPVWWLNHTLTTCLRIRFVIVRRL